MEDQVIPFFQTVKELFSSMKFEVIYNSFSSDMVHYVLRDHEARGFGGANNKILAAQKAYSEFVERKTMSELNKMFKSFKTSNGFAAHVNQNEAIKNSRYEIIERDAILLTWHGKQAPYWIKDQELESMLSSENKSILKLHENYGLDLKLGLVALSEGVYTAIVCVRLKENRFYIDSKTGESLFDIFNALIESVTFHSHFMIQGYKGKNISLPKKPMDHFDYYLRPKKGLEWFFKGSHEVMELPAEEIITMDCHVDDLLNLKTGRFVCYSEAPMMQSYYCGLLASNQNKERFLKVFGKELKLNKQIHPLA